MTAEDRDRVFRIVDAVLDLPESERAAALDALAGVNGGPTRRAVEQALADDPDLGQRLSEYGHAIAHAASDPGAVPLPAPAPAVIGRYVLRERLGAGGMGEVFLAEQRSPIRRTVAIKLVKSGLDSHEVLARFEAERQTLARLEHPNIARVLDAGMTAAGRPYFVMEYVPGVAVTQFADAQQLSLRQRLELFREICAAVTHAHTRGVIHRDLKPGNLLAYAGDDGLPRVKVIDFGVAKALAADAAAGTTRHTLVGTVIGTYEYMSPEQADGRPDIDTRSDVYGLGVLLYELLTGTRPFERQGEGRTADEQLRCQIADADPPRPSARVAAAPTPDENGDSVARRRQIDTRALVQVLHRELDWIPLKALRKDPARRYASVAAMSDDVGRFLDGLPLDAAPESGLYRVRKFVDRHAAGLLIAVAIAVTLVAGIIGTSIGLFREASSRRVAQASAYRSAVAAADVALHNGDGVRFARAMDAAPEALRGWEWDWLRHAAAVDRTPMRTEAGESVNQIEVLSDRFFVGVTDRDAVLVWDAATGDCVRREPGVQAATDGATGALAVVRPDGSLDVLDGDTGRRRWHADAPADGARYELARHPFARDGSLLAVRLEAVAAMAVFDARTGVSTSLRLSATLRRGPTFYVDRAVPRGTLHVDTTDDDNFVVDIDAHGRGTLRRTRPYLAIDGHAVDAGSAFGRLITHDRSETFGCVLPRRGLYADYSAADNAVVMIPLPPEVSSGKTPGEMLAGESTRVAVSETAVTQMRVTPDERFFLVRCGNGRALRVGIDKPRPVPLTASGEGLALSPDGRRMLTLGWGMATLSDPVSGMVLWRRNAGPIINHSPAWSPDGRRVVFAGSSDADEPSELYVLDATTGRMTDAWPLRSYLPDADRTHGPATWAGSVSGLAFTPDGRFLRIGRTDGSLVRVDTSTWTPVPDQPVPTAGVRPGLYGYSPSIRGDLVPSPGGRRLAQMVISEWTHPLNNQIVVRDNADDRVLYQPTLPGLTPTALAWTPDGRSLVTAFAAASGGCLRRLDADTGVEQWQRPISGGQPVGRLVVTPDGSRVIAITPSAMTVYDAHTGEVIVESAIDVVTQAAMTPDATLVLCFDRGAIARLLTRDVTSHQSAVREVWPSAVAMPQTVAEARQLVDDGLALLAAAAWIWPPLPEDADAVARVAAATPAARDMAAAIAGRSEPSVNQMNSDALTVLLDPSPSAVNLRRAEALLRRAITVRPVSMKLHANLGDLLMRTGRDAESRVAFDEAARLAAIAGRPPSGDITLRRAILAARAGDPNAAPLYDQARQQLSRDDLELPDNTALLSEARRAFGR